MLENKEVWRNIKGYKDYQISNHGRVWNSKKQRLVAIYTKKNGYEAVHMYANNGKRKHEHIHRLVALAFIPNPNNLPQVNHIDRVRNNNHVENLEWVTHQENVNKSGLLQKIIVCDLEGNELYRFDSIRDACRELNLIESNVSLCLSPKQRQKTHRGFTFKKQDLN